MARKTKEQQINELKEQVAGLEETLKSILAEYDEFVEMDCDSCPLPDYGVCQDGEMLCLDCLLKDAADMIEQQTMRIDALRLENLGLKKSLRQIQNT